MKSCRASPDHYIEQKYRKKKKKTILQPLKDNNQKEQNATG